MPAITPDSLTATDLPDLATEFGIKRGADMQAFLGALKDIISNELAIEHAHTLTARTQRDEITVHLFTVADQRDALLADNTSLREQLATQTAIAAELQDAYDALRADYDALSDSYPATPGTN